MIWNNVTEIYGWDVQRFSGNVWGGEEGARGNGDMGRKGEMQLHGVRMPLGTQIPGKWGSTRE